MQADIRAGQIVGVSVCRTGTRGVSRGLPTVAFIMSFENNFQIKTLLRGAMAVLSMLLILMGGVGLHGISQSNDALKETYSNQLASTMALSDTMLAATRMRLALDRNVLQGQLEDPKVNVDRSRVFVEAAESA
jgi:methyl-accepting chemotaxis protein-1 (serine sensor receptor)